MFETLWTYLEIIQIAVMVENVTVPASIVMF